MRQAFVVLGVLSGDRGGHSRRPRGQMAQMSEAARHGVEAVPKEITKRNGAEYGTYKLYCIFRPFARRHVAVSKAITKGRAICVVQTVAFALRSPGMEASLSQNPKILYFGIFNGFSMDFH